MIGSILGGILFAGLFVLAFAWPWIAEEMVKRKHEKEEENDAMVYICRCKKCGYVGRISLARHGSWNRILQETVWDCPNCGGDLWDEEDVKSVWREEAESEIERIKKGGAK